MQEVLSTWHRAALMGTITVRVIDGLRWLASTEAWKRESSCGAAGRLDALQAGRLVKVLQAFRLLHASAFVPPVLISYLFSAI